MCQAARGTRYSPRCSPRPALTTTVTLEDVRDAHIDAAQLIYTYQLAASSVVFNSARLINAAVSNRGIGCPSIAPWRIQSWTFGTWPKTRSRLQRTRRIILRFQQDAATR